MPDIIGNSAIRYCLNIGRESDEGLISYQAYGIEVQNECGNLIATIKDVSLNREKMEEFIEKLNEYGLSILHLEDAIEDFLADS